MKGNKKMNKAEFEKEYRELVKRAYCLSIKARKEGLSALDGDLNEDNDLNKDEGMLISPVRDVLKVGLRLAADQVEAAIVDKILSNIIDQEQDHYKKLLMTIKKEIVLSIRNNMNHRVMMAVINSYVDIKDDEAYKMIWE
jgi:flagellar motor component MotA